MKPKAIDDPYLAAKKKQIWSMFAQQLSFAFRSLDLNEHRILDVSSISDKFESLRSLVESYRIGSLAVLLEHKSRYANLALGFQKILLKSELKNQDAKLKTDMTKMSIFNNLFNSSHLKFREKVLSGIHDLIYCKENIKSVENKNLKIGFMLLEKSTNAKITESFIKLVKQKRQIVKIQNAVFGKLSQKLVNTKQKFLLKLVLKNSAISKSLANNFKNIIVRRIVNRIKANLGMVIHELKIKPEIKEVEIMGPIQFIQPPVKVLTAADIEELDGYKEIQQKHQLSLNDLRYKISVDNALRRLLFAQKARTRLAMNILVNSRPIPTGDENFPSMKLALNTICLNYKIKVLDSLQVLRYPTIRRHEKQKASSKIVDTLEAKINKNQQLFINRLLKKASSFQDRFSKLFVILEGNEKSKKLLGLYAITSNKTEEPEKLIAISNLTAKIISKNLIYDKTMQKCCFIKLCCLSTSNADKTQSFLDRNYMFDIHIEKNIKLEKTHSVSMLKKLNLKNKNAKIKNEIENKKIENAIIKENIKCLNDSTRNLQRKKEIEAKELLERKNLNFSYDLELKKLTHEMFGNQKMTKNDYNSFQLNDQNENLFKQTIEFNNSFIKNNDVLNSSVNDGHDRQLNRPILDNIEGSRSLSPSVNFGNERQTNRSKAFRKPRDQNLEKLFESGTTMTSETVSHLISSKTEIETQVQKIMNTLAFLQDKVTEKTSKIEEIQSKIESTRQKTMKKEMLLIDLQDNKGLLNFEKKTLITKNEANKSEIEKSQIKMNEFSLRGSLDSNDMNSFSKLKAEYFVKREVVQENERRILTIDQDLIEKSKSISVLIETIGEEKDTLRAFQIVEKRLVDDKQEFVNQAEQLKNEVQNAIHHATWNTSLIENFEGRKRNIVVTDLNSNLNAETLDKFQTSYLKIDLLKIDRLKLITNLNKLKSMYHKIAEEIECNNAAVEENIKSQETNRNSTDNIPTLNQKHKSLMTEIDKLNQSIANIEPEKIEIENQIEEEKAKIKDWLPEFDDVHKPSFDESMNDQRNDLFSKNTFIMSTKMEFNQGEHTDNSTLKDNLLNQSKSNLTDENIKPLLMLKLNSEIKSKMNLNEANPISFDEVLNVLVQKKKLYLQNSQLSFFNYLKKTEAEERIKSNSCQILDFKEKLQENEAKMKNLRLEFGQNTQELFRLGAIINTPRSVSMGGSVRNFSDFINKEIQTEVSNTFWNLPFKSDKIDVVDVCKRINPLRLNEFIDSSIIPKVKNFAVQKLQNFVHKKKIESNKVYKTFLEMERVDIFDNRTAKVMDDGVDLDLYNSNKDGSFILEEYFPVETISKSSVKKLGIRTPMGSNFNQLGVHSYQFLLNTLRNDPKTEPMYRQLPTKIIAITQPQTIIKSPENFVPSKIRAVKELVKRTDQTIKNATNLNFYQLKLATSVYSIQQLMGALTKFRLGNANEKFGKLKTKMKNRSALLLLEALQKFVVDRKQLGFDKIKNLFEAKRKKRNLILTKWTSKGDSQMRKQLRVILQYWRHVKNDNIWNANVLKHMVLKCEVQQPLIALWRLMLFKKRDYTCKPKVVKGLLILANVIDLRLKNKAFKEIYARERPKNDFSAGFIAEKRKLLNAELINSDIPNVRDTLDVDLGGKSKQLFYLFSYFGILNKRLLLKSFYRFLNQVKNEPIQSKFIRFEPKAVEEKIVGDTHEIASKFLFDQQIKSRAVIDEKDALIQDLKEELNEKNENISFMQLNLLNFSLLRVERIIARIVHKNEMKSKAILMEKLLK